MRFDTRLWTYGAELELSDIDRNKPNVLGCGWDKRDFTMVNGNGIAVDPKGVCYDRGGEINTYATKSIKDQVEVFEKILDHYPEASVNYRSNLHIHIRVPNLRWSLFSLKKLQRFIHEELPPIINMVEPIPVPTVEEYPRAEDYEGARRRYRRRKISHHTFLSSERVERQMRAESVEGFLEAEVPRTKEGVPMWHAQPRVCVNIRQLRETDTIEFRHFPLSLSAREFSTALNWCEYFLNTALNTRKHLSFDGWYSAIFPKFPPYIHWMEERYRQTCHDGSVPKDQILKNIERFLYEDSRCMPGKCK